MNTAVELELDLQIACDAANLPTEHHFRLWAEVVLQGLCDEAELSIRLIDESESAQLNMQYRQKSGATNVLSFPADLPPELELSLLGDLAICKQVVEREADEQHKACLDHWAHMVIHGTLHLLGYNHIDDDEAHEMETLEVALLKTLNISNPYTPIL